MKRTEIRRRIRYNIRETTAQIWTNAELNDWINTVQKEVAVALDPIYNPDLMQIYSVSASSGDASYALPTTVAPFLKILGNADLASNTYVLTDIRKVRPHTIGEFAYNTSKKISYLMDNSLYLYPTPGASDDGKLIYFPYLAEPLDFSDDTTTDGNLSDVAYALVIDKVSGLALMKVDTEEAANLSQRFFQKYERDLERLNKEAK